MNINSSKFLTGKFSWVVHCAKLILYSHVRCMDKFSREENQMIRVSAKQVRF